MMKRPPHKLRNSIVLSFGLVSLFLATVYGLFISQGMMHLEDELFARQLQGKVDRYLQGLEGDAADPAAGIALYLGTENMEPELVDRIGGYPPGYHEIHFKNPGQSDVEYHFVITALPESDRLLYAVHNVSSLEISDAYEMKVIEIIILGGVLSLGLSCLVGWFVARRVSAPLESLTARIEEMGLDNLPTVAGAKQRADDEVGFLEQRLEEASQQIKDSLLLEQQFTRNASHELRSPVTVIKGAVELLEEQVAAGAMLSVRPLQRIQRAVLEMETLIETFLELARSREGAAVYSHSNLVQICEAVLDDLSYLKKDKPLQVGIDKEQGAELVAAPPAVAGIAIKNLLRNALQHTQEGRIEIAIRRGTITIEDSGSGIDPETVERAMAQTSAGGEERYHGFGLPIVSMLCTRYGWSFDIQSVKEGGTVATLVFPVYEQQPSS